MQTLLYDHADTVIKALAYCASVNKDGKFSSNCREVYELLTEALRREKEKVKYE